MHDSADRELPFLARGTVMPNRVTSSGFVYGIEGASLGNCLSTMANLIAFSVRNDIPVIYPNLRDHAALFALDPAHPHLFSRKPVVGFNAAGLAATTDFIDQIADGYEGFMARLQTIPPEWLPHYGDIAAATVFLRYEMHFRDWAYYEAWFAQFASRGNGIVLPGAYWLQFQRPPVEAAEDIRTFFRIRHEDSCVERASVLTKPQSALRIGLHIRRGDYKDYKNGEYYWDATTYVHVMREISQTLGQRPHIFIVCSHDHWEPDVFAGLPHCHEAGGYMDDFVALSRCDVVIGPPSTFANWAAFLGRGKRLILTPAVLADRNTDLLSQAAELAFPNGSGVPGDFWDLEHGRANGCD